MKYLNNYAFAKAYTSKTTMILLFLGLLITSFTASAQSWAGTWKSNIGNMIIQESNGAISSKFTMNYNGVPRTALLYATLKNNVASGTIKVGAKTTLHIGWVLTSNDDIEGVYANTLAELDSDKNKGFTATRIKFKQPKLQPVYKAKKLEDKPTVKLSSDKQGKLDRFNNRNTEGSTGASSGTPKVKIKKKEKKKMTWREAEAEVDRINAQYTNFKVTVSKLYVYEEYKTRLDTKNEMYGTIGIRVRKKEGNKMIDVKNREGKKPRVWSVSSSKPITVNASGPGIKLEQPEKDPTGLSFTTKGVININKSRTFRLHKDEVKNGAQVNIQMKIADSDPGIDDNFPWKQRNLTIKNIKLGEHYLMIQSEEDEKSYQVAVSFKVEEI